MSGGLLRSWVFGFYSGVFGMWFGGVLRRWTCDREVPGSIPTSRFALECDTRTHLPFHMPPSSVIIGTPSVISWSKQAHRAIHWPRAHSPCIYGCDAWSRADESEISAVLWTLLSPHQLFIVSLMLRSLWQLQPKVAQIRVHNNLPTKH